MTIYGNVAHATHGETVSEVLGGGDASKRYQKLGLRQSPLTFVRNAASPTGTASTLQLRVNDLLWTEVPSFYERTPNEHVYTTRMDDDGNTVVQFGDGTHGARVPTGQENVRATYRKGSRHRRQRSRRTTFDFANAPARPQGRGESAARDRRRRAGAARRRARQRADHGPRARSRRLAPRL